MSNSSQILLSKHTDTKLIQEIALGRPVDFSFYGLKNLKNLKKLKPRALRLHEIPERGLKKKFISASIWLNNNNLFKLNDLRHAVNDCFELPMYLTWIDISFNEFDRIDQELLQFTKLRILYLHGNKINDIQEISKLKPLSKLRTLTLHGNPIARMNSYRCYVLFYLPQIRSLDFSLITRQDRNMVPPAGIMECCPPLKY